jgi:hypothetical protein
MYLKFFNNIIDFLILSLVHGINYQEDGCFLSDEQHGFFAKQNKVQVKMNE